MDNKTYSRINDGLGWTCFAVAAWTYLSTVEPSISFWDCPEYVACAAKGEVGHPPGNAFFLLAGRMFANMAGGDASQCAVWVNRMSALLSAATIMLLYWTITALTLRLVQRRETAVPGELTWQRALAVWGSGVVGALVYTWSDTFWFSAVEAEVYGFSSFMTALTFWLILKWERRAVSPTADRYLVLIAYVVGLSVGVHLLNLLCLPAIVLVAYYRHWQRHSALGVVGALGVSVLLIGLILYGIIPGVVWWAQRVELLVVNGCGGRYNTGALLAFILLLVILIVLLVRLHRTERLSVLRRRVGYNVVLALLMFLVGYSTFAQVLIRSAAGLPLNENAPDNVFALERYLNREQYGSVPLLWGQTFASTAIANTPEDEGRPLYAKQVTDTADAAQPADHYYIFGHDTETIYDYNVFFPRMHSAQPQHQAAYRQWSDYHGKRVQVRGANGAVRQIQVPTWRENMTYFLRYQVGYMYWRYFMWNFVGRQNDLQGHGEADRGNWVTGFTAIDNWLLGSSGPLPRIMTQNRGHNVYYMLPLLLGLMGMVWQYRQGSRGRQGTWIILSLFVMTGLAIVVYINQTPLQPRERDYAYAGSFYAFSIWIGMGVAALCSAVQRCLGQRREAWAGGAAVGCVVLCLGVPLQMVGQTWDDHDRSDRYLARDFGRNYLSSVDEDGILFVNGDNETFPLWYAIEVEGYRRDVRVCNLAYLQTDWYLDQMRSPAYGSAPLPIPMRSEQYAGFNRAVAHIVPRSDRPLDLHLALNWLLSDDVRTKTLPHYQGTVDHLPAHTLTLPVDADAVRRSDCIGVQPSDSIPEQLTLSLQGKRYVGRQEIAQLAMLDSIARGGWRRPLYYASTMGPDNYVGMGPYLRTTGMARQVVPLAHGGDSAMDVERTYHNVMHLFRWGNADMPGIYLDETARNLCYSHRQLFGQLVEALERQGDYSRAVEVAERSLQVLPGCNVPHDLVSLPLLHCLARHGNPDSAREVALDILSRADDYLHWTMTLSPDRRASCSRTIERHLYAMSYVLYDLSETSLSYLTEQYLPTFKEIRTNFERKR